jgi:hypothetical protein
MSGLTVGLRVMPCGEVGLIFVAIGVQLILDARPVMDEGNPRQRYGAGSPDASAGPPETAEAVAEGVRRRQDPRRRRQ